MDKRAEAMFQQLVGKEDDARPSHAHEDIAREILQRLSLPTSDLYLKTFSYFCRYGYIPLSEKSISEIGKFIGSAPWVGLEGGVLEPIINSLIKAGVLEFATIKSLTNQLVIRISPSANTPDIEIRELLDSLWQKTENLISHRQQIITNVDWTHSKAIQIILKQAIENAPIDGVIKLMAYHGRTWLPSSSGVLGFLLDVARSRTDLKFQVLIVDPKAQGRTIEGATQEEHMSASAYGISSLKKLSLPLELLNRFDVRTYGKDDRDSFLRCVIVETKERLIKDCYVTVWFFGNDRGFHGREIKLDGKSSLAFLCRGYFDRVFTNGWPQVNPVMQLSWILKQYWFRILTLGIIPLACVITWIVYPSGTLYFEIGIGSIIAGLADLINK